MTDLFSPIPATKIGESNGRFLGYLANGESAERLRERWKSGELPDLNHEFAKAWMRGNK